MTGKQIDCELVGIIDQHGELACLKYAAEKCKALAQGINCYTKDTATDAAEAQVGLLLVQMILAKKIGLECVTGKVEEIVSNLNGDKETWQRLTLTK